jgi:hypothetical protein
VLSRLAGFALLVIVLVGATGGVAFGVISGKTVPITAAPWTVVVRKPAEVGEPRYAACDGVIIGPREVLTAGHCVMRGDSANPAPASDFTIEAGVSNFHHPLASDHPQNRAVSALRVMPGHIAANRLTSRNSKYATGHDLAILTLSQPLDLNGDDARAAYLPRANARPPSRATRLVMAGFGRENQYEYPNGTLNEVAKSTARRGCSTSGELCVFDTSGVCLGDSGSGLIEPGPHPTVVGVGSQASCEPALDYFVSLTDPAILRFIRTGK